MSWNPFRSFKPRSGFTAGVSAASPMPELPFPGLGLADLQRIWAQEHRFVPAAEAYGLVIEARLRTDFGLAEDDPRFATVSAVVRSLDPRDRLTGYARSDALGLNLQLARLYLAQGYAHNPTTCALRTSGNEFILYSIRPDGIAVLQLVGKNFTGLNRALSTPEEIATDAARQHQRAAVSRRSFTDAGNDRRSNTRQQRYSQMGYARGDAWVQTLTTLAYTLMAQDKGRLTPQDFGRRVLHPLLEQQAALFDATGLDCTRNDDIPTETGVGLTGTFRILSDATGWDWPDEATLDAEIAAAHAAIGHTISTLPPGKAPLVHLRDPGQAMHILNTFTDQLALAAPIGPMAAPQLRGRQAPQANPLAIAETLLYANMDAVNRLWNSTWERYTQLVNDVLNSAYNTLGDLHPFIREVCRSSQQANPDAPRTDHIALIELVPFSRLAETTGTKDATALRAAIIRWFTASLTSSLVTGHLSNTPPAVFDTTGRRTSDAAKFALILHDLTEEQARNCLIAALRVVTQNFLAPHGLAPRLGLWAASAPILPGYISFDSAISLIGGVHRQLDALRVANTAHPETPHLFASRDGFYEPAPHPTGTPASGDLASAVATLVAQQQPTPAPHQAIDYFALVAPVTPRDLDVSEGTPPQKPLLVPIS
jgi:hypothetical protein